LCSYESKSQCFFITRQTHTNDQPAPTWNFEIASSAGFCGLGHLSNYKVGIYISKSLPSTVAGVLPRRSVVAGCWHALAFDAINFCVFVFLLFC
jgi:hypothetical protein